MKKVFLLFFVSLCFGVITVVLWTGTARAATGGLPACQASLNTCNADLGTCNANLGSCTTNLSTCNTNLAACQAATCNNGIAEFGEACDGENLQGETCQTQGFQSGTLVCVSCDFDTTGCTKARFVDNGDGTVTDNQEGLMWEKKDDSGGIHDKDDTYTWSTSGTPPDGTAFTVFLNRLNNRCRDDETVACVSNDDCGGPGGPCGFAGHRNWRLPEVNQDGGTAELETIVDCSLGSHCINQTIFGPTAASHYWSAVTTAVDTSRAWDVDFNFGFLVAGGKSNFFHVRAVRTGP
ncbi:MAG: DUF1566 domain-containing protein [Thermodesulfobacteriota bacterium]